MENTKNQLTKLFHDNLSVTVAVPCYNAAKFLPHLLESIFEQTRAPDEILVIDDGSYDATKEIAQKYKVKTVVHDTNRGLAAARNSAIKNAKGEIIVFFDADTLPKKESLELMLNEYRCMEIAGVGGQELFSPAEKKIDLWRNLFWRQTHGHKRISAVWIMGLCCSYRKKALIEIGGFDEKYRHYGEDVDIGIRLTKAGHRLVYLPEVEIFHKRTDTLKTILFLVFNHSYWQSRALRKNGLNSSFLMKKAIKWFLICTGSSLVTRKDIVLALLSPIICLSAIAGRLMELILRIK